MVLNKSRTCSSLCIGSQNGGFKILQFEVLVFSTFSFFLFLCCMSNTTYFRFEMDLCHMNWLLFFEYYSRFPIWIVFTIWRLWCTFYNLTADILWIYWFLSDFFFSELKSWFHKFSAYKFPKFFIPSMVHALPSLKWTWRHEGDTSIGNFCTIISMKT